MRSKCRAGCVQILLGFSWEVGPERRDRAAFWGMKSMRRYNIGLETEGTMLRR